MGSMSDLGLPERQMTDWPRGASKAGKGYVGDPAPRSFSASIGIDWKIATQPALQVLEYIEY